MSNSTSRTNPNSKLFSIMSESSVQSPGRRIGFMRNQQIIPPRNKHIPKAVEDYYLHNIVKIGDKIDDGFYDVEMGIKTNTIIPTLHDLKDLTISEDDNAVSKSLMDMSTGCVLVDRAKDQVLCDLIERFSNVVRRPDETGAPPSMLLRIQRLASEIARHLGGVANENESLVLIEESEKDLRRLRTKYKSVVIPISRLMYASCRHRALLFKFVADRLDIPCSLERGEHTDMHEHPLHAWNCVNVRKSKIGGGNGDIEILEGREYDYKAIVDLIFEPGRIYKRDSIAAMNYHRFESKPEEWVSGRGNSNWSENDGPEAEGNNSDDDGNDNGENLNTNAFGSSSSSIQSHWDELCKVIDSHELISVEDIILGKIVGKGSFGEVYRGKWRGTEVAIKKLFPNDLDLDALAREVSLLRRLRHPNILLYMGASMDPSLVSIVSEYMHRGDLFRLLHRPRANKNTTPLSFKRKVLIALDVSRGLHFLHSSNPPIIHRDLKSPNILIDKYLRAVISDFGLSRIRKDTYINTAAAAGSPAWMAPEVLRGEPFDEKADVYSFGVILYEIFVGLVPYDGIHPMQVVGMVGFQNHRLGLPSTGSNGDGTSFSEPIRDLILNCWHADPNERITTAEIVKTLSEL